MSNRLPHTIDADEPIDFRVKDEDYKTLRTVVVSILYYVKNGMRVRDLNTILDRPYHLVDILQVVAEPDENVTRPTYRLKEIYRDEMKGIFRKAVRGDWSKSHSSLYRKGFDRDFQQALARER